MSILGVGLFRLKLVFFCFIFGLRYLEMGILSFFVSLISLFSKFCLYIFIEVFNLLFFRGVCFLG